jgi:hypothetical protein
VRVIYACLHVVAVALAVADPLLLLGGAGAAFLTNEEAVVLRGLKPESELVKWLTPKLEMLLPAGSVQTLVNSEKYAWI